MSVSGSCRVESCDARRDGGAVGCIRRLGSQTETGVAVGRGIYLGIGAWCEGRS